MQILLITLDFSLFNLKRPCNHLDFAQLIKSSFQGPPSPDPKLTVQPYLLLLLFTYLHQAKWENLLFLAHSLCFLKSVPLFINLPCFKFLFTLIFFSQSCIYNSFLPHFKNHLLQEEFSLYSYKRGLMPSFEHF